MTAPHQAEPAAREQKRAEAIERGSACPCERVNLMRGKQVRRGA